MTETEEQEQGFQVTDAKDIGDVSDQKAKELLEAAKGIGFVIKKAELRDVLRKEDKHLLMQKLNVQAQIGPMGVDGEGKHANKIQFIELTTWFDSEIYQSEWWKNQARFPLKSFLQALDFDPKNPPKLTDELLESLVGREFIADILVRPITVKNAEGKYVDSGDKKNEVANFKKAA